MKKKKLMIKQIALSRDYFVLLVLILELIDLISNLKIGTLFMGIRWFCPMF